MEEEDEEMVLEKDMKDNVTIVIDLVILRNCRAKMHNLEIKGVDTIVEETSNEKLFISSLMTHNEESEAWYIILSLNGKKFIDDTLLTLTLKNNLLSVGWIIEKNYKLAFDNK
jgi:hypothetical protein